MPEGLYTEGMLRALLVAVLLWALLPFQALAQAPAS